MGKNGAQKIKDSSTEYCTPGRYDYYKLSILHLIVAAAVAAVCVLIYNIDGNYCYNELQVRKLFTALASYTAKELHRELVTPQRSYPAN